MKASGQLWLFLIEFFSGQSCRESKSTHFIFCKFFLKVSYLGYNVEKYDIGIW